MKKFFGNGVSGGIAEGEICVLRRSAAELRRCEISDIAAEKLRLGEAKRQVTRQLSCLAEKAAAELGAEQAAIFEIHMLLVEDGDYNAEIERVISEERVNAEYAVKAAGELFAAQFAALEDPYMRERAADIDDISRQLIDALTEQSGGNCANVGFDNLPDNAVICAEELSPSETARLDRSKVRAFVTAAGSANSHTAILARAMDIPAVVGLQGGLTNEITAAQSCIVDGGAGELIISPDERTLAEYRERHGFEQERRRRMRERLLDAESISPDGRRINIFANIAEDSEAESALRNGAGGIGLFRSEFLFMRSCGLPSEEEQFAAYSRVLKAMDGRRVVVRTMDLGADKQADCLKLPREENPALGVRGIRLCLTRREIFKTQLRALYRASVFGRLAIMFPMIASESEVRETLGICAEVRGELTREGIPFSPSVEHGIMIETPAAAIVSDRLAPLVDFFSVGTNDLTQYTLACDRQNAAVAQFCDPHHEAVLRLIEYAAGSAHACGKWIGICGELAADTSLTDRFLSMGIDELSVSPSKILDVKLAVTGSEN